jgi:SAM-dependent methyltransferase
VSLVAVAQAVHWFDFDRFYAECRRVLVPGGVVAVWTYELFHSTRAVDAVIDRLYRDTVGAYWPPERKYVEAAYQTLPFPWAELDAPRFDLRTDWSLEQVVGYLGSWSAVQRYQDAKGADPLPSVQSELAAAWPSSETVRLIWPIHLRIGRA